MPAQLNALSQSHDSMLDTIPYRSPLLVDESVKPLDAPVHVDWRSVVEATRIVLPKSETLREELAQFTVIPLSETLPMQAVQRIK